MQATQGKPKQSQAKVAQTRFELENNIDEETTYHFDEEEI